MCLNIKGMKSSARAKQIQTPTARVGSKPGSLKWNAQRKTALIGSKRWFSRVAVVQKTSSLALALFAQLVASKTI